MKKFSALILLSSLLLASCSISNPLKKDKAPVADTTMEQAAPEDTMAPKDTEVMEEKAPEDAMMQAKVEVDAAMQ